MKIILGSMLLLSLAAGTKLVDVEDQPRILSSTEVVTEGHSGIPFKARVDTGAHSCSIHCEDVEIENPSDDPLENIGKPIRFLVKNKKGQSNWVKAEIADYVSVKTSERTAGRYKVRLTLHCQGIEKEVLVTLNNREHMRYSMLIGRNFLRKDFVVAVD